jgi:DNA polymerase sigma
MDKPFSITRKIEGVSKVLRYNSPLTADGDQEENFVSGDTVNPLQQMKTPSVKVDIITNTIQKEAEEANKAMALFGVQQLAPVDLHKAMFPKKWESTLQNSIEFNQAMQLVQAMQSLTPEGQALVAETIQNVAQQEAVLQQLEGNKQNGTL